MKTLFVTIALLTSLSSFAKCDERLDENVPAGTCLDDYTSASKPAPTTTTAEVTCPTDADVLIANISRQATCADASKMATECAWGSSMDVSIAGAAGEVCLKEAGTLSKSDSALLTSMRNRCTKAYGSLPGTINRSFNSFCHLTAIEFINNVIHAADQN